MKNSFSVPDFLQNLPNHWTKMLLYRICTETKNKNRGNVEKNLLSLSYGQVVRKDITTSFGLLPESFDTYQIVEPNNIILRLTDLQNDKRSFRVGFAKERGIITSAYICLSLSNILNARFTYFLLHSYDVAKYFYSYGGGVRQSMRFEDFKTIPVSFPPLPTQKAIADFLDRKTAAIDALIAKKQRLLELLAQQRQALITHAVTKGLNPDAPMKDSGIPWLGQIPAHWESGRAKQYFFEASERSKNGEEVLLTVSHLTGVTRRSEKKVHMIQAVSHVDYKVCHPNDLAINTMWAWMGALGISLELGIVSPSYNVYRFRKSDITSLFFDHLFRTPNFIAEINRYSKGIWSSRLRLYPTEFLSMQLPYPPNSEQQEIVDYIELKTGKFKAITGQTKTQITKLKEYRQALITAAVTGQIDVSTEAPFVQPAK